MTPKISIQYLFYKPHSRANSQRQKFNKICLSKCIHLWGSLQFWEHCVCDTVHIHCQLHAHIHLCPVNIFLRPALQWISFLKFLPNRGLIYIIYKIYFSFWDFECFFVSGLKSRLPSKLHLYILLYKFTAIKVFFSTCQLLFSHKYFWKYRLYVIFIFYNILIFC